VSAAAKYKSRWVQLLVLQAITILFSLSLVLISPQSVNCRDYTDRSAGYNKPPEKPPILLWGPYITGTSENSAIVNIKTSIASKATVYYCDEAYYNAGASYNSSASDNVYGSMHHIALSGLVAGTTYHYQVCYERKQTGDLRFSTLPKSGPFSFAVYGDTQDEPPNFSQKERHKLVADRIAQEENILFVINTGDLVNDGNDTHNWDRFFDAIRLMATGTTIYPVHGNHDGNSLYFDIFGVSPYYSFDCAGSHFTVIDSVYRTPEQAKWLNTDLDNNMKWKFVFFHHPFYTSESNHFGGWKNLRNEWEETFISRGVSAVWNGHIHAYERYLEKGIQYIVAGIGGGPYTTLNKVKYAGCQKSFERILGYSKATVDPVTGLVFIKVIKVAEISKNGKNVTISPEGTVIDEYILSSPEVDLKTVQAYPDNTSKPDETITRAEFVAILVKAFEFPPQAGKMFADTVNHWSKDFIAAAAALGIADGYGNNSFGPDDLITREQMAVMIARALKLDQINGKTAFADNSKISKWAKEAVFAVVENNLMQGFPDNTFQPHVSATRAEAVYTTAKAMNKYKTMKKFEIISD